MKNGKNFRYRAETQLVNIEIDEEYKKDFRQAFFDECRPIAAELKILVSMTLEISQTVDGIYDQWIVSERRQSEGSYDRNEIQKQKEAITEKWEEAGQQLHDYEETVADLSQTLIAQNQCFTNVAGARQKLDALQTDIDTIRRKFQSVLTRCDQLLECPADF
jgi:hypothetical protein